MSSLIKHNDVRLSTSSIDVVPHVDDLGFIRSLIEEMYVNEAVGLAAPQLGIMKRVIVIDPSAGSKPNTMIVMINPVIKRIDEMSVIDIEGCLSFPGVSLNVSRSLTCDVCFLDETLVERTLSCSGFLARIVQHEIDHLEGKSFLDRVSPLARKMALKRLI